MTTVTGTSGITGGTSSASTQDAKKASLDYDAFLKLLVAQMKNQDPLNPTDPTQQMSQLASFSNVEQSIKMNQKLEAMITVSALDQANGLIGRKVTSPDGSMTGTVKSVGVYEDGIVATLADGKQMMVGSGVKVEQP